MTTRKEMRRQQCRDDKIVRRAEAKDHRRNKCVWNSLLAGSVGLETRGFKSHERLLSFIRDRIKRWGPSFSQGNVKWQGVPLSDQEMEECKEAVLNNIQIGDGYCCGACDPLLAAFAFAFRVNVDHAYLDHEFRFEVDAPRRCVRLRSSFGHMAHVENSEMSRKDVDVETFDGRTSRRDECHEQGFDDAIDKASCDAPEQKDVSASTESKRSGQRARRNKANSKSSDLTIGIHEEGATKLERRAARRALKLTLSVSQLEEG